MTKGITFPVAWCILAVAITPGSSQDRLVEISHQSTAGPNGNTYINVKLTNLSTREVVGFVLRVEFQDEREPNKKNCSLERTVLVGESPELKYGPRMSWLEVIDAPKRADGTTPSYGVSLDYVRFTDGSGWGPDVAKQSNKLAGMILGRSMERRRLSRLLKERGPAALIDEIKRTEK